MADSSTLPSTPAMLPMIDRLIKRARRNAIAATILSNVPKDALDSLMTTLEKYSIRGQEISCIYGHVCDHDMTEFVGFIGKLAGRPTGCPSGCEWSPAKVDESHIFGPKRKESEYMCVMADCESEAPWACSRCYLVRYCSASCQALDHPRHKDECKKTVAALKDAAKFGRPYARGVFKATLNIADGQFDALWRKYAR